ncbi:hypothetical protein JO972_09155 [Verrucomicrobiaceae bacterium 5K15]|uniref:Uncharacterized protein n=1 Tax=Oceaniferula flava TaxID=2800421 RepID=A0AAE2SBI6_9BACT|nr:hypothetical protein [Oceaniferula flavus]MBK1855125.1 hypothetical protein [Oceaniferula flavus]MBM1136431.1 hypothetical protein [Oceaniferula flavus]
MLHRLLILPLAAAALLLTGCGRNNTEYVTTIVHTAADGLNLQAVTDLATKVKTAKEFEEKLNEKGNTVNNLDLNEDNKVDYIKVTEINDGGQHGFSLTTELSAEAGEEQELCVIQFEQEGEKQVTVQTHGNEHIYGNNHYYHHRTSMTDVLLWSYLISSHRPYYSSWGYNNYPGGYSNYAPRSQAAYANHHKAQPYSKNVTASSKPAVAKPIKSPNFNKTATKIKAPLKNPTSSQKSFQKRNPSKTLTSRKGFGSRSSSSSSRFGSSSSSRSRSSFGGGK